MDGNVFVITEDMSAFIDLLNDERRAKLVGAIYAFLKGEKPDGLDDATSLVFRAFVKESDAYNNARALHHPTTNQDVITEELKKENKEKVAKATKEKKERNEFPLLENPSVAEAWKRFSRMRDSINKPLSTIAKTKALRKLERLSNGDTDKAVAILDQSTDNCWEGLYELPEDKTQTVGQRTPRVQAAYGFSTERNTDLNSIVWEQIRKGWEEDGES